ncbi:MAG: hypothetical protein K9G46_05990 [Flavobacteriales bacterium]|jgi:hypothetical protein|nr:hypothetical protein [Flavobacteriales bacterium]
MEVKIDIGVEQLLSMVKQLPQQDVEQLLSRIQTEMAQKSDKNKLQELLRNAPTWSDEDFSAFQEARDYINKWREK